MLLVSASAMLVYTVQKNIAQVLFLDDIFLFLCVGRILKAGIRISQNELIGQLPDMKSAHPGQAACPCWASSVPQLGKHLAHFLVNHTLNYFRQQLDVMSTLFPEKHLIGNKMLFLF